MRARRCATLGTDRCAPVARAESGPKLAHIIRCCCPAFVKRAFPVPAKGSAPAIPINLASKENPSYDPLRAEKSHLISFLKKSGQQFQIEEFFYI
jgi:hypothetical protein